MAKASDLLKSEKAKISDNALLLGGKTLNDIILQKVVDFSSATDDFVTLIKNNPDSQYEYPYMVLINFRCYKDDTTEYRFAIITRYAYGATIINSDDDVGTDDDNDHIVLDFPSNSVEIRVKNNDGYFDIVKAKMTILSDYDYTNLIGE